MAGDASGGVKAVADHSTPYNRSNPHEPPNPCGVSHGDWHYIPASTLSQFENQSSLDPLLCILSEEIATALPCFSLLLWARSQNHYVCKKHPGSSRPTFEQIPPFPLNHTVQWYISSFSECFQGWQLQCFPEKTSNAQPPFQ